MSKPTIQGANADPFCSLFGHNLTIKSNSISKKDIQVCKICQEEFILKDIDAYSGLPKNSDAISLFRSILRRIGRSDNRLISLQDIL